MVLKQNEIRLHSKRLNDICDGAGGKSVPCVNGENQWLQREEQGSYEDQGTPLEEIAKT